MATPDKSVELQNVTNDNSSNRISFLLAGFDSKISVKMDGLYNLLHNIYTFANEIVSVFRLYKNRQTSRDVTI